MAADAINPSSSSSVPPQAPMVESEQELPRSLCQRIGDAYFRAIRNLVDWLCKHRWFVTAMVLGTFLTEPFQALKASVLYPFGWKGHFNFYGLNPESITKEAAEKRPILLFHGNLHNQSAWFSLARKLQKADLGPVYTVNLPSGGFSEEDQRRVNAKIAVIQAQYKEQGKEGVVIDLVGHSRGAQLAGHLAFDQNKWRFEEGGMSFSEEDPPGLAREIGKVIGIGSPIEHQISQLYEITGNRDVLNRSTSNSENRFEADVGHLELLYDSAVQDQVIEWLKA